MKFSILTLFPAMFESLLSESILKRAQENKHIEFELYDIRDFTTDKHRRVDHPPYGGGAGMLLACQPLFDCIEAVKKKAKKSHAVVFFTPQGKRLEQIDVEKFSEKYDEYILVCGHYEGIDQRVRDSLVDYEVSIGDFVLTGGELAAAVFSDAVSRLVPGVLGKQESFERESFSEILGRKREYPQYTRPENFRGMIVPEVLLSGHHQKILDWQNNKLT
ncbi:tRNA (guanosine(37)-N1)-methyltransferase TrmD [Candidatus Peregrinibacteria bacterium]|nr:MAG: tRNA (guanosine(37)-N1)-methyltransferase TrmD [Candidatus Peregrinibacteria bacterium]